MQYKLAVMKKNPFTYKELPEIFKNKEDAENERIYLQPDYEDKLIVLAQKEN
jgi:hypothetical protein